MFIYTPAMKNTFYFFIILTVPCLAQKEANVWVFDFNYGLDFNYNRFRPFIVPDFEQGGESACICDKRTGQLLFYTDGRTVYNRDFQIMPNGKGLLGGYYTAQAALIVPVPGKDQLYYLFTTRSYKDTHYMDQPKGRPTATGLYYSVINMGLEEGRGDVQEKNILLMELSSNKLTAVPHANGKDYWLITHEWGTSRFTVFPATVNGVGPPAYYVIGAAYKEKAWEENRGLLKPSPNGNMLCHAVSGYPGCLELYDFDKATGAVLNLRELGSYVGLQRLSFSPDNTKLYFTHGDGGLRTGNNAWCYQMDLASGNTETIIQSRTELFFTNKLASGNYDTLIGYNLQLGPDGRLYAGNMVNYSIKKNGLWRENRKMCYINKPNLPGWQCEPKMRDYNITIKDDLAQEYPNLLQSYFNNLEPVDNFYTEEECGETALSVFPNPTDNYIHLAVEGKANCVFPIRIRIFNVLGQSLDSYTATDELPALDLSNYSAGIYILAVETPFKSQVLRVIKK